MPRLPAFLKCMDWQPPASPRRRPAVAVTTHELIATTKVAEKLQLRHASGGSADGIVRPVWSPNVSPSKPTVPGDDVLWRQAGWSSPPPTLTRSPRSRHPESVEIEQVRAQFAQLLLHAAAWTSRMLHAADRDVSNSPFARWARGAHVSKDASGSGGGSGC